MALIPGGTGTPIGDMVNSAGLASAFNGVTNADRNNSAYLGSNVQVGYIGKDWGSGNTKTVTGFICYASNDRGFDWDAGTSNVTITLQGSTDNFSSSVVDLGSSTPTANSAGLVISKLTGITTTTAYRYHRVKIDKGDASDGPVCAEVEFYEADPGQPAVKRMGGVPFASPNRGVW